MSENLDHSNTRHSFRKSSVTQNFDMPVNGYGQTVAKDNSSKVTPIPETYLDKVGGLSYKPTGDIFDAPAFQAWVADQGIDPATLSENDKANDDLSDPRSNTIIDETAIDEETLNMLKEITGEDDSDYDDTIQDAEPITVPSIEEFNQFEKNQRIASRIKRTIVPQMTCINADCNKSLPPGAKFCSQCGQPQLGRHCIECGYSFAGREKFCPECGKTR